MIEEAYISQYITDTFAGVETETNFGYIFFFHGSDRKLPFATLASSDNEYDRVSNLDRANVFRLNIGVTKETFHSLFGADADRTRGPGNRRGRLHQRIQPPDRAVGLL